MQTETAAGIPTLYTHSKRPAWGKAILAWSRADKRAFQFDDGNLRRFKTGYWHFLEPVDLPLDEALELAEELEQQLEVAEARKVARTEARSRGRRLVTLKDQIAIFRHLYPRGFEDPAYQDAHRGGADGRLKRHWDKTVARGQELLDRTRLERLIAAGDAADVVASLRTLASDVTLTSSKKHREVLDALPASREEAVAKALLALLWEDGRYSDRFDRFVASLRSGELVPTWPLVTLPAALLEPQEHIAVKPSVFQAQMRWMAPTAKLGTLPDGASYRRLRKMVRRMVERLTTAGLVPADLIDVHAFIWDTMRPKNAKLVEAAAGEG